MLWLRQINIKKLHKSKILYTFASDLETNTSYNIMEKIILQNKDLAEYVKDWDKDKLYLTQDINEAYNFSSVEHAEVMRIMAQDATGNRWRTIIED